MEAALGRRELLLLPLSLLLPPLAAALLGPAAPLGQVGIKAGVKVYLRADGSAVTKTIV